MTDEDCRTVLRLLARYYETYVGAEPPSELTVAGLAKDLWESLTEHGPQTAATRHYEFLLDCA